MIYKIRHKKTGLFATGGRYAKWSKQGKIWTKLIDVQKAIDFKVSDEEHFYTYNMQKYERDKALNKRRKTKLEIKLPKKPEFFFKDCEIVKYNLWINETIPIKEKKND